MDFQVLKINNTRKLSASFRGKGTSIMIQLLDLNDFFAEGSDDLYYVGFLKTKEAWMPLCFVSEPEQKSFLDTLYVSRSQPPLRALLDGYASRVEGIEDTFIHYLFPEEIRNLIDRYGLERVAVVHSEGIESGCGCGCGCSG